MNKLIVAGDSYVDWVGVDGYNWGSAIKGHKWTVYMTDDWLVLIFPRM